MTETPLKQAAPLPVEEGKDSLFRGAKEAFGNRYSRCQDHVRESPTASVLIAGTAGYCLRRLPVRDLVVTHVRVLSALAPPALFLFGAFTFCEILQKQCNGRE